MVFLNKEMRFNFYLCVFLLVFFNCAFIEAYDCEYWQQFQWIQFNKKSLRFYTTGEVRIHDDVSKGNFYRISENMAYEVVKNLDLEFHYSYIYSKPKGDRFFTARSRIEFEVNPTINIFYHTLLHSRARFEIEKNHSDQELHYTYRLRCRLVYLIENNKLMRAIECSDEIFYRINTNEFRQNRFIPLGIEFKLGSKAALFTYFVVRNFISAGRWHHSIVIGSDLRF